MKAPDVPLDSVEWRVDSEPYERDGKTTCRFVPYVDAKTVADLLDEWVGPDNWQDEYTPGTVAGKEAMWCRLSVRISPDTAPAVHHWVAKTDIGTPSNREAAKGAVSDAFKRAACLKWGVARNVYSLPTLYAHCRTFTSQGKTKAAPDGQRTLDDIRKRLMSMGFESTGGRVREPEPEPEPEPEVPKPTTGQVASQPAPKLNTERFAKVCERNGCTIDEVADEIGKSPDELLESDLDALKVAVKKVGAAQPKVQAAVDTVQSAFGESTEPF